MLCIDIIPKQAKDIKRYIISLMMLNPQMCRLLQKIYFQVTPITYFKLFWVFMRFLNSTMCLAQIMKIFIIMSNALKSSCGFHLLEGTCACTKCKRIKASEQPDPQWFIVLDSSLFIIRDLFMNRRQED